MHVLVSTLPQYTCVAYMGVSALLKYKFGLDMKALLSNNLYYCLIACSVTFNLVFMLIGLVTKIVIKPNFFKEKVSVN